MQLPQVLDLSAAGPLAAEFVAARGQALKVDASQVDRIGGLCLQVLLAARNQWSADGVDFVIADASANFAEGVRLMAADDLLPAQEEVQ